MSDALTDFEVEHELCSASLPSVPHASESAIDQALEALHLRGSEPVSEKVRIEPEAPSISESQPVSEPQPIADSQPIIESPPISEKPTRSKSRTSTRAAKLPQPKTSHRLFNALRSRRLRIIATAVGVLLVVGLIGLNWQRSVPSGTSDDLAEMELAEFQDDLHIGSPRIGRSSEPRPLGAIGDAEAASAKNRSLELDLGERFPPVSLANHSEQEWPPSSIQTVGGVSRPPARGTQAAWLTGQIEIETSGTSRDESRRRINGDAR